MALFVKRAYATKILARVQRSVVKTVVVKTTDFGGSETLTTGSTSTIIGAFFRRSQKWRFDKDGLVEQGDAYFLHAPWLYTLNKNDLLTVDTRVYRVQDTVIRYSDDSQSTSVYQYSVLFLNT